MATQRSKKYKPKNGDEIEFHHGKEKHTGTIFWMGTDKVSVYPHSVNVTDKEGKPIDCDWFVSLKDIIGEVEDVRH